MLEIQNVSKTFNAGTVNEKTALNGLNLKLNEGDFVTVIGGNGAGKSTMLNAVAGVWPVLRTGTGCITFLWKINPRPGWKYGCCYLHYQPGHCIYFHKTESISTGIYLSERKLYYSILHQKFCCQYSG